jgi:ribonuclease-3
MQQNIKELDKLEQRLNYRFKNRAVLLEALTHKSYKKPYNNERLEFLGDAVLNLIVGEYLYSKFDSANEGELSKIRASLVNENGFTILAKRIDLGSYLFMSQAEENNSGREKPSLLSNAFEAIIGAMYLESDIDIIRGIIYKLLEESYDNINLNALFADYKTALQEITQAKFAVIPEYNLIKTFGPDHKKEFEVEVMIDEKSYGTARGNSKKVAQQKVAKLAIEKLNREDS